MRHEREIAPGVVVAIVRDRLGGASTTTLAGEFGIREPLVWNLLYRLRAKHGNMRAAYKALSGEDAPR